MTATCRSPCCSARPRASVAELFERGFRRNRAAPLALAGPLCRDAEDHAASFSLAISDGRIAAVGFRASTCATLIAYCELIAESVTGLAPEMAAAVSARDLIEALPGVPAAKQGRAVLALAAFRAAVLSADPAKPATAAPGA